MEHLWGKLGTGREKPRIAGVDIAPGDILVGDNDGLIVLTFDEIEYVLREAEGIIRVEEEIFSFLDAGHTFEEFLRMKSR